MRIDLWTDPASPDCTQVPEVLGAALARFGATVEVVEHAFEVDRQAPVERRSFDAQRVIALARREGGPELEARVRAALVRAHHDDGAALGDHEVLTSLVEGAGLDRAVVEAALASDDLGYEVRAVASSARMIGVEKVPTFVFDRKFALSGPQPVEALLVGLATAAEQADVAPTPRESAGCGGNCAACACTP